MVHVLVMKMSKKKQHLYQLLCTCIITSVCFVVYAKKYGCNILSLILNESVVCYKKYFCFHVHSRNS